MQNVCDISKILQNVRGQRERGCVSVDIAWQCLICDFTYSSSEGLSAEGLFFFFSFFFGASPTKSHFLA